MNTTPVPLNLVSFVSRAVEDILCTALKALNRPVQSVQGHDWLAQALMLPGTPIVLAIGSNHFPRDRLLSSLREQWITPALVVIADDKAPWDAELLAYCREILRWPCQGKELSLRLARGCEGIMPPQVSPHPLVFRDELASLNLIGQSPAFLNALELIKALSECEAPVLIEGETGTGKEMAARAIHYLGLRQDHPFIPINCGALSDTLLENELFGHERGAYTDAKEAQLGLVAQAHQGTLFLDEVESLSPKAQVALLRFLQNQEYRPLGSRSLKQADVRVISASNEDLEALVRRGNFRQDLLFRLNVMPLFLPPLRERSGDIESLATHFLYQYSLKYCRSPQAFHPTTLVWMKNYPWPGNVRELENFVHRALLLSKGPLIPLPPQRLPSIGSENNPPLESPGGYRGSFNQAKTQVIAHFEKQYLECLMAECHGNISLAAKRAGKERRTFGKLLKKYQINRAFYIKSKDI
ncbi:Helix-turn-helix, Fis-type [Nitrosococcus oceani ATCC 19707]|uniref:Helix-turn-helix, Fis-type n=1 Tax=Nitrosococcus oceani (strain ATCC 19707 / BCRC 17464 / JCM 30415 / NCIMB 11848 / C-107) TaxID=323261 RepID=Q3J9Z9_NITOC|nr:sigma-54 dependent transcriptional regulator [Nitrosococcus oceani]ABA58347.1 Helix-turn-helix, Fis-type [Nitrosococcus oceani ATCC 19707]GEM18736.1 ATPase AAA [Nitrosococcus oceani]